MTDELIMEDFAKTKMANGNYRVTFTMNGEGQVWLGVEPAQLESWELFAAYVLDALEYAERMKSLEVTDG